MSDPIFKRLRVTWNDNVCAVGHSCIHARGWTKESMLRALDYCPEGHFTPTFYVSSDTRKWFTAEDRRQAKLYGQPCRLMYQGAYFSFPLNKNALRFMLALGLVDEMMVMASSGGRFPFPESELEGGYTCINSQ